MAKNNEATSMSIAPTVFGVMGVLLLCAVVIIVSLLGRPAGGLNVPATTHVVHVQEYEFGIRMPSALPSGNVVFVDTNTGSVPHELVMFKLSGPKAMMPLRKDGSFNEESAAVEDVMDSGDALAPGQTPCLRCRSRSRHVRRRVQPSRPLPARDAPARHRQVTGAVMFTSSYRRSRLSMAELRLGGIRARPSWTHRGRSLHGRTRRRRRHRRGRHDHGRERERRADVWVRARRVGGRADRDLAASAARRAACGAPHGLLHEPDAPPDGRHADAVTGAGAPARSFRSTSASTTSASPTARSEPSRSYVTSANGACSSRTCAPTEENFRLLVESIGDHALMMLDPSGCVVTWNPEAERIKGWAPADIIGRYFSVFYLPDEIASGKPERDLERAAADGRAQDAGWRVRGDGRRFWAETTLSAVPRRARRAARVCQGDARPNREPSDTRSARGTQ